MNAPPPDDHRRFAAWLTEHGAIPRKLSRAYTFEATDAEVLHQEMLVQLWRSLPQFRGQSRESTWIYRVCPAALREWLGTQRGGVAR